MSEFKFLCPECGQKILGDAAYSGKRIDCPACKKGITVPAAPLAPAMASTSAAVPPKLPPTPPPPPRPVAPSSAAAPPKQQIPDRYSGLAIASLICSVFVPLGSIPGIICGHMAKARMKRDIFLVGEKMANAGLIISYCILLPMLVLAGIACVERWHSHPVMVRREAAEAKAALQPRILDEVVVGENEDEHEINTEGSYTMVNRRRNCRLGGRFSYQMQVLPQALMVLNCRYWGGETKGHVFDIAVENQIIATQSLTTLAPGHFVDFEYKIPADLTRGKTEVKVEFRAHRGTVAGALYDCQMLKP